MRASILITSTFAVMLSAGGCFFTIGFIEGVIESRASSTSTCDASADTLGDGYCDGSANNEACGYDAGDCCESTCTDGNYTCGENGYDCVNPDVSSAVTA